MPEYGLEISWPLTHSFVENGYELYQLCSLGIFEGGRALTDATKETMAGRGLETALSIRMCGSYFVLLNHEFGHNVIRYHQKGKWGKIFFNPFENLIQGAGRSHNTDREFRSFSDELLIMGGGINFSYPLADIPLEHAALSHYEGTETGHHFALLHVIAQWTAGFYLLRAAGSRSMNAFQLLYDDPAENTFGFQDIAWTQGSNDVENYSQLLGLKHGERVQVNGTVQMRKDSFVDIQQQVINGGMLTLLSPATIYSLYRGMGYIFEGEDTYRLPFGMPHYTMVLTHMGPVHDVEVYLPSSSALYVPGFAFGYGYGATVMGRLKIADIPFGEVWKLGGETELWKQGPTLGGMGVFNVKWDLGSVILEGGVTGKTHGFHPLATTLRPEAGSYLKVAYHNR